MKAGNKTSAGDSNPDRLFSECLKQVQIAEQCAAEALRKREDVRRAMYRAAVAYQRLAREHHDWLLAQAASAGGIDALLEGWFRPLAMFGEDWHELLRDVGEGVKEAAYLSSTAGSFTRRQRVAALVREKTRRPLPPTPDPTLPAGERIDQLEDQNRTLRVQLDAARKEAAELRRLAARQERRIGELESALNKIEKAAAGLKVG